MTAYETNFFNQPSTAIYLVVFRFILFSVSVWLLYTDIKLKGFNYMFYTTWGAYITSFSLLLLLICSLYKLRYLTTPGSKSEPPVLLWKLSAFSYQCALNIEFVVTFCFWLYLFVFMTDLA